MKRRLILLVLAAAMLLSLSACGGKKPEFDPSTFTSEILSGAQFKDSMNEVDGEVARILYALDSSDVKNCIMYAGTAATAEEIAVFEAVDSAAAGRILAAAQARVSSQIESYKNYGPAEAMLLEQAIVKQINTFVVVVVCSDTAGAEKIASKYF